MGRVLEGRARLLRATGADWDCGRAPPETFIYCFSLTYTVVSRKDDLGVLK